MSSDEALPDWAKAQLAAARKKHAPKKRLKVAKVIVFPPKVTSVRTIRTLARAHVGDLITDEYLEGIRKRLLNTKLFRKVSVFWEESAAKPGWANLYIECKDKFTWFIVPLFWYQQGRWGGALAYANANLFGTGKRLGIIGRWLVDEQMFAFGYEDPHIRQTDFRWTAVLGFQRKLYSEYSRVFGAPMQEARKLRTIWYQQLFTILRVGYRWAERLQAEIGYDFALGAYSDPTCYGCPDNACQDPWDEFHGTISSPVAFKEGGAWKGETYADWEVWRYKREAIFEAILSYDTIVDIFGIKRGWKVRTWLEVSHPYLGSEYAFVRWYVSGYAAFKFFHEHMLELRLGHGEAYGAPFHREFALGGQSLPGYVYRQALGDTVTTGRVAYTVPLFHVWWLSFRQIFYYNFGWIFFRDGGKRAPWYDEHGTVRRYHPDFEPGPGSRESFLQSVGTGLRLHAKAIAMPLLGVDVAYGIEANAVRFLLFIGQEY